GPPAAPTRHGCRDRIFGSPCSIGVLEEVGARVGFLIHVGFVNAALRGSLTEGDTAEKQRNQQRLCPTHLSRPIERNFEKSRWSGAPKLGRPKPVKVGKQERAWCSR